MLSDLILELLPGLGLAGLVDQLAPDFGRDELHHKVAELVLPEGNALTLAIQALICISFFWRSCDIVGACGRAWVCRFSARANMESLIRLHTSRPLGRSQFP